ncbi:MAG: hypothetical protein HQK87_07065, partial [Nitrospinae bacterium]|nr:hypothetical protein [Nitrospinota bacterium]
FDGGLAYAEDDLAILDWDGGVILSREGAFDDDVAIVELANIQLLSLRTLDAALSRQFDRFRSGGLEGATSVWRLSRTLRSVVGARAQSLLELDAIGDTMKLYGDWYDARLYALAARKLSVDKWRATVEGKLSTLEKMFEMVATRQGELYNIILEVTIVLLIVLEIVLALTVH